MRGAHHAVSGTRLRHPVLLAQPVSRPQPVRPRPVAGRRQRARFGRDRAGAGGLRDAFPPALGASRARGLAAGGVRVWGATEPVLGAYEMHSRLRSAPAAPVGTSAPQGLSPAPDDGGARILSLTLADLGPGEPALLEHADLVATIVVRGRGDEQPNIGFMIEQSRGSGITSLATHEEGAAPVRQADGSWRSVLTFPALPLHSGEYVVSA